MNHGQFTKFIKISPRQTFLLYGIWTTAIQAWGLSVANFLWPQTWVMYLWNTPTSRGLYIYIYIYIYIFIYLSRASEGIQYWGRAEGILCGVIKLKNTIVAKDRVWKHALPRKVWVLAHLLSTINLNVWITDRFSLAHILFLSCSKMLWAYLVE